MSTLAASVPGSPPFAVRNAAEVMPDQLLPAVAQWLWIGDGGTLRVELESGSLVELRNVPDGTMLRLATRRVLSGTTASSIVAFW